MGLMKWCVGCTCFILAGDCYDGRRVESKGQAHEEARETGSRMEEGVERSIRKTQN